MIQAYIRCVTFAGGEESTLETDGQIEFKNAQTCVSFAQPDYTFSITAIGTRAEITRRGQDAYRAILEEGYTTPLESDFITTTVYTHTLKTKRTDDAFSVMAEYALGEGEPTKLFVTAKFKQA
ncbi:MAG: hypothetical protein K2M95_06975 [Clostridiales bacterium]|nr:hypothetical protein [Clostridiales bacterium]